MKKIILILLILFCSLNAVARKECWVKKCLYLGNNTSYWYRVYNGFGIPIITKDGNLIRCKGE